MTIEYIPFQNDRQMDARIWEAGDRIRRLIDLRANEAHHETKRMAESARRSIGQLTRLDNFWRRK